MISRKKSSSTKKSSSKESWYEGSKMNAKELKYCRCLLEQLASELERYGKIKTDSYAVCAASISRKKETKEGYRLRSRIVQAAVAGKCTADLHIRRLPTKLLYAYAKLREKSLDKDEMPFFKHLPSPKEFFHSPSSFRTTLLQAALRYQQVKQKDKDRNKSKQKS